MRLKLGFQNKDTNLGWYDLREDWVLIESSLAKQYGIRIRQETDMSWVEFCTLISGLMPDTPLGNMVGIRAETDPEVIKDFTSDQSNIYNTWQKKQALNMLEHEDKLNKDMEAMGNMLASMFGKKV